MSVGWFVEAWIMCDVEIACQQLSAHAAQYSDNNDMELTLDPDERRTPARSMHRHAREAGWIRKKMDGKYQDICPACGTALRQSNQLQE